MSKCFERCYGSCSPITLRIFSRFFFKALAVFFGNFLHNNFGHFIFWHLSGNPIEISFGNAFSNEFGNAFKNFFANFFGNFLGSSFGIASAFLTGKFSVNPLGISTSMPFGMQSTFSLMNLSEFFPKFMKKYPCRRNLKNYFENSFCNSYKFFRQYLHEIFSGAFGNFWGSSLSMSLLFLWNLLRNFLRQIFLRFLGDFSEKFLGITFLIPSAMLSVINKVNPSPFSFEITQRISLEIPFKFSFKKSLSCGILSAINYFSFFPPIIWGIAIRCPSEISCKFLEKLQSEFLRQIHWNLLS